MLFNTLENVAVVLISWVCSMTGPSSSFPRASLVDADRASNHWNRKQRKPTDATSDLVDAISQVGDRLVSALSDLHTKHREASELSQSRENSARKEEFAILASRMDQATKNMDKLITLMETSTRRIADAMDRQTAALENMARLFATRVPAPSGLPGSQGQPVLSSSNLSISVPSPAVGLPSALNTLRAHHPGDLGAPKPPAPSEAEECQPEAKKIKTEDD